MSVINELLKTIEIPRMLKIKQFFNNCAINDVENKLNEKLNITRNELEELYRTWEEFLEE